MAKASLRLAGLPAPQVVLTLSVEEALYVTAELAGGNSYFHGLNDDDNFSSTPFSVLVELLSVGATRRGPHAASYRKHKRVAEAIRPTYDNEAGRKAAEREGLLES